MVEQYGSSGNYGYQYEVQENGKWVKHVAWFKTPETRNNAMKQAKLPSGYRKFRRISR